MVLSNFTFLFTSRESKQHESFMSFCLITLPNAMNLANVWVALRRFCFLSYKQTREKTFFMPMLFMLFCMCLIMCIMYIIQVKSTILLPQIVSLFIYLYLIYCLYISKKWPMDQKVHIIWTPFWVLVHFLFGICIVFYYLFCLISKVPNLNLNCQT